MDVDATTSTQADVNSGDDAMIIELSDSDSDSPAPNPSTSSSSTSAPTFFECPHCPPAVPLAFLKAETLQSHILRRHTAPPEPEEPKMTLLKMPRQVPVIAGRTRRYFCEFCDKLWLTAEQLRLHRQTHFNRQPGARLFSCQYCNLTFNNRNTRTTHLNSAHRKQLELSMEGKSYIQESFRVFPCTKCISVFIDPKVLAQHQARIHGIKGDAQVVQCRPKLPRLNLSSPKRQPEPEPEVISIDDSEEEEDEIVFCKTHS